MNPIRSRDRIVNNMPSSNSLSLFYKINLQISADRDLLLMG